MKLIIIKDNVAFPFGDKNTEERRNTIKTRGGIHLRHEGKFTITHVSTVEGMDFDDDEVTVTSYEEIYGYSRQVEIDGFLQWEDADKTIPTLENVPKVAQMFALYKQVWKGSTPIFGILAGYKMDHLNI